MAFGGKKTWMKMVRWHPKVIILLLQRLPHHRVNQNAIGTERPKPYAVEKKLAWKLLQHFVVPLTAESNRLKNTLKNSLSCRRVFMLFLSLLCTCFHLLFFVFVCRWPCSLTGILKLLDRNKALNCAELFSPLIYIKFVLNQLKA